ncbi:DEAD/DEAH box helicase family protein [Pseudomonas sp.]|uniref:DEAD/DEAH box helicase family protein n=1 Tax=Pseudomonas sp. TaxID=306 RepID=UPI0026327D59|nr:DEAD/DEAH box helicase family protein [Pseudomonas sp.]
MKAKPFQEATVTAVMRAFKRTSTGRYLVADEPGLGKTFVARRVLSELSSREKLTVLYVCANQSIAAQNVDQLLGELPVEERKSARASADRPGLLPLTSPPDHPCLNIYSLTPGTAFSGAKRRHKGRVQERAFATALLEYSAGSKLQWLRDELSWNSHNFDFLLKDYGEKIIRRVSHIDKGFAQFVARFSTAMRECINAEKLVKTHVALKAIIDTKKSCTRLDVTGWCRNSLAAAALEELDPGLIIFDEFQRFRDLMANAETSLDPAEARIRNILTAETSGRLLLLSATPYEALRPATKAERHEMSAVRCKIMGTMTTTSFGCWIFC